MGKYLSFHPKLFSKNLKSAEMLKKSNLSLIFINEGVILIRSKNDYSHMKIDKKIYREHF